MPKNNVVLPPQTIGIIGGGQLGRMMAIAARYMGYKIAVLDPTPDCPTAQVADEQITTAYDDRNGIKKLAEISDVITYEFENVDLDAATYLEQLGKLPQGAYALEVTQNREKEKTVMQDAGLPVPYFHIVSDAGSCEQALDNFTFPAVIKTCSGGYDGKGQLKLESADDIEAACAFVEKNEACIIEQWVPFDREISVVFTRAQSGEMAFFPIAENDHKDHILYQTTVPANISETVQTKAIDATKKLAEKMNIVGTFAIEMFVNGDNIFLNEMAPRPHNSGHYTIEACNISQFGQHIRAVCGLELTPVSLLKCAAMVNILGEDLEPTLTQMPGLTDGIVHLYGKDGVKPKRKMGHVTFIGNSVKEITDMAEAYEEAKQ
ncbi:5-(carboxyamino)imidazole ribonucleotide synthase [Virgibacillus siamensis]|uniref:N5-carboxyaminoimidazole ribonucleotide synthase n=1 Tax=Virgibacillus siamensis TaxID=480071 RepID=A0ABP3R0R5_9BACI